jgi:hypothetical protein
MRSYERAIVRVALVAGTEIGASVGFSFAISVVDRCRGTSRTIAQSNPACDVLRLHDCSRMDRHRDRQMALGRTMSSVGLTSANPPSGVGILYILLDLITVAICSMSQTVGHELRDPAWPLSSELLHHRSHLSQIQRSDGRSGGNCGWNRVILD